MTVKVEEDCSTDTEGPLVILVSLPLDMDPNLTRAMRWLLAHQPPNPMLKDVMLLKYSLFH